MENLYDVPAEGYDELYGEEQVEKYEAAFRGLDLNLESVLDVGCGTGLLLSYLRENGFNGLYVGVDPDLERLEVARRRGGEVIQADAHHLPFRAKCFDSSLSFTVVHLLRIREAIREVVKVSRRVVVVSLMRRRLDLERELRGELERWGKVREAKETETRDKIFILELG